MQPARSAERVRMLCVQGKSLADGQTGASGAHSRSLLMMRGATGGDAMLLLGGDVSVAVLEVRGISGNWVRE
jgi:hypothetical protein